MREPAATAVGALQLKPVYATVNYWLGHSPCAPDSIRTWITMPSGHICFAIAITIAFAFAFASPVDAVSKRKPFNALHLARRRVERQLAGQDIAHWRYWKGTTAYILV